LRPVPSTTTPFLSAHVSDIIEKESQYTSELWDRELQVRSR
jgi:hypothetical protein